MFGDIRSSAGIHPLAGRIAMTERSYPWSKLEIDPTRDQKAIRKAYAAKLKVTRPDDDPKGFQALVEARDSALMASRWILAEETNGLHDASVGVADHSSLAGRETEVVQAPGDDAEPPDAASEPAFDSPAARPPLPDMADNVEAGRSAESEPLFTEQENGEEEAASEVEARLAETDYRRPWHTATTRWSAVFDALEKLPLAHFDYFFARALQKLAGDLEELAETPANLRTILRELDRRFELLKHDRILFEYLGAADAALLLDHLSSAVGRVAVTPARVETPSNFELSDIEPDHARAAFSSDAKMLDFFMTALRSRAYPRSFSWLALLFPLPVCLYYRLYKVAIFMGVLSISNAVFRSTALQANYPGLAGLQGFALVLYLVISFSIAFNVRRMRLGELARKIAEFKASRDGAGVTEAVAAWGQPNRAGAIAGIIILLLVSAFRFVLR